MPTPGSIRRLSPLPLLLIGLAALAVLVLIPWFVHAQDQTPTNQDATGRPVILASPEGAPILAADTSGIADPDGIPNVGSQDSTGILHDFSYRWIRVDGDTETAVGTDSARYRRVEADIGKLIKVHVSFTDKIGNLETVTSLPFGPLARPAPPGPLSTLVSNTGQSHSATVEITGRYDMGFKLGTHGQGYEISSVSIELAAVPSSLTVSLWMGPPPGLLPGALGYTKLFDFQNPSSFQAGLNRFTAPPGAFAYQGIAYYIVLSDFGSSLSIKGTTSDDEDGGGETGATLSDSVGSESSVLRLAVWGSKRDRGILVSTYAQVADAQEIVSVGDEVGVEITVGAADRYLIRGVTFSIDDTTPRKGGFTNPWELRDGTTELFRMASTRQIFGINEFTAPQGATVAGSDSYVIFQDIKSVDRMGGVVLSRHACTTSTAADSPAAAGVTLDDTTGDFDCADIPLMAVLGEPLDAMVQNLGQTDNSYVSLGGASSKVASQGFTTGPFAGGYRFQGIGVNIEGSAGRIPDGPTSVSVAVHADSNGKPGAKLFDLVSPTEFGAGHSFFEAPPGTNLAPDTSYVMVWRFLGGAWHRLQVNSSDDEDSGALEDASIADTLYVGPDLANLTAESDGKTMEIAVYGRANTEAPFVAVGIPVTLSWLHIPDDVEVGYQFRVVFVTHRGRLPTSGDIDDYNKWVKEEADKEYNHRVIRSAAPYFKAIVCTETVDARANTEMTHAIGVPIHWIDGGWDDHATLIADTYTEFYSEEWGNTDYGAIVTGNTKTFYQNTKVWTGCDAFGDPHPEFPMGANSPMDKVAVGTPRDPEANHAPLGAVDVDVGFAYYKYFVVIKGKKQERLLPLYAISPVFTVVR